MTPAERRDWVVAQARALGFDLCGVAPAADFDELARMPDWLARGYAGQMRYLHDPRRRSPQAALPGARSLIVCALNYNTPFPYSTDARASHSFTLSSPQANEGPLASHHSPQSPDHSITRSPDSRGWISRYAWGDDYHHVLGAKLDALLTAMRAQFAATPFDARAYVDTGPVHERIAAHHAGLGWLGKNTCLINDRLGSWLFLGVILTTLDLAPSLDSCERVSNHPIARSPDHPILGNPSAGVGPMNHAMTRPPDHPISLPPDLCGQCTQCLDACPTGALGEPYVLDARRCISYLTIELRGPIPAEFHDALGWHLFGCDICQDVCPYNRRAPTTSDPRFLPRRLPPPNVGALLAAPESQPRQSLPSHRLDDESAQSVKSADSSSLFAPPLERIASLSESAYRSLFRGSAIKRTKHAGLARNAQIALKNT